ncbi:rho guanine nucleotide exchange factor 3-like [Daphnia pulicaria]|uniref:rho guanine nucleotide exchange factor 3-like n=1 Tax=Daphnia pulicaria TaxID=35523 RepID=UPI001EEA85AC|nr:rho guanine nucleotide exchange factor 3-like [Daphnia pulicaria]
MPDEDSLSVNSLFVEPPKQHKSFSLRKRKKDQEDSVSTHSLNLGDDEGPSKRKKRLGRVASLANIFTSSGKPLQNAKQALKKSISGMLHPSVKEPAPPQESQHSPTPSVVSIPSSPALLRTRGSIVSLSRLSGSSNLTPYRPPALTPTKHRIIHLWSETWGKTTALSLNNQELKRQETMYELWHGECDLIEDISMLQRNYHDSLLRLGLITQSEAEQIFGGIHSLLPIHSELKEELTKAKGPDGSVESVGNILLKWVPKLEIYVIHCANQIRAKSVLDEKRSSDPRVEDFLTRCLESPFSRRLDVWSYLDVPRSRLVKYPLLIKQILKFTPDNHGDHKVLEQVLRILTNILDRVDKSTGLGRCKHVISQIDASEEMSPVLTRATTLICDGPLKTSQGLKLQCFLFDSGLVLTRSLSNNRLSLYKTPFEVGRFKVVDLGTKVGRNNSFLPGSSGSGLGTKHVFKVETLTDNATLVTFNEHNKKQWMLGLHRVVEEWQSSHIHIKETSDLDSPRKAPKIKASLNIRGANRRNLLPRGKLQVVSAPQLPRQPNTGGQQPNQPTPSLQQPVRFLRSKGSICLNQTLSPETHRICTRSCTSLRNSVQP